LRYGSPLTTLALLTPSANRPQSSFRRTAMKRIASTILVLTLCCLFVGGSLFAQQATVNHGVSLRGDPSTKNPPVGHLKKNENVTLLSTRPRTGFYHVQTSDGTKGWVGVKYLTVEGQAGTQPPPSPTPSASRAIAKGAPPHTAQAGKSGVTCPAAVTGANATIKKCPVTGCGPSLDPNLNKQKNIATDSDAPVDKDFGFLVALPDPVPGFAIGNTREKLTALGEGQMIRVVAYALKARVGGKESCNCGLKKPADTDNHIVLVDPALTNATLAENEATSQTAEFTPRVRLTHPKLVGADLQTLIDATPSQALLVRVTGVQLFDSEHSLGPFHLKRTNNWEIHPVFGLEYCPTGKTCTKDSDANWVNMEQ
jgi:uncharacterized protein YgiM (DUF1202 family)